MDARQILMIVVLVVMGWFAFGIIYNLRRGDAILKWMQGGLPRIGERTTFRWLGSSVAELVIGKARDPMRRLETIVVLSPRDVPWIWLPAYLNGRRDTLIFRSQLVIAPKVDLDLVDPKFWTGKTALRDAMERGWTNQAQGDMLLLAPSTLLGLATSTVERLDPATRQLSTKYQRISLRRGTPHLEVHLPFPDFRRTDALDYFKALQELARLVNG